MGRIATLEGHSGSRRSCLAVRKGKNGQCVCSTYGPPGSGHDFKTLCGRHNLPVVVGSTRIGGTNMSKKHVGAIDFPPINGFDGDGMIGALLPTPEQFKESLMVAGGAAGSILVGSLVLPKLLSYVPTDNPLIKAAIVLGIAVVGGGLAFRFSPQLAVGIIGGLGGLAVATAVGGYANIPVTLGYLGGFGNSELPALPGSNERLGMGDVTVRNVQPYDLGGVQVTPQEPPIGSWLA